jgi:AcrR family transcriptional regulator
LEIGAARQTPPAIAKPLKGEFVQITRQTRLSNMDSRQICLYSQAMAKDKGAGSPRERLLAAADVLFYEEGVHTVGIDRVIERAGVAKASLYSTFGSKEELVRAYLMSRQESRKRRVLECIAKHQSPRGQILGIFDRLGESFAEPSYRGCAFINASAEGRREGKARSVCNETRAWMRTLFAQLARDAGAADPEALGGQLMLLYDGATITASMDGDPSIAATARSMAAGLLDAQTKQPAGESKKTRRDSGAAAKRLSGR